MLTMCKGFFSSNDLTFFLSRLNIRIYERCNKNDVKPLV